MQFVRVPSRPKRTKKYSMGVIENMSAFPESDAAVAIAAIAAQLSAKPRGLAGLSLNITPAGR